MSYRLTLSQSERAAFDWIGGRYGNGDDMSDLIRSCETIPAESEWDACHDVTYIVPQHVAWEIADLAQLDDYLWPCFADDLADKMQQFVDSIV